MEASGIKVKVQVDTDDLDIAIGKAKEFNRELEKAKALSKELASNDSYNTIVIKLSIDETVHKERFANTIGYVMEALRRDIKCNY